MNWSLILLIVVFAVYLVWKLMGPVQRKKAGRQKFSIRKHRQKEVIERDEDEEQSS